MNRTIAVVMAALIAVLAAIGLLTGANDGDQETAEGGSEPSVAAVARRVERIRELRFDRLPPVRQVTKAQARTEGLREFDRDVSPREVAAEERLLKLLDLLPQDAKLRELAAETLSSEVGGFYDPRTGRLSIVGETPSGLLGEITLAHELTHALEDQRFGLDLPTPTGFNRDRAAARSALHEGTATIAMVDYAVLKQAGTSDVPASLRAQALGALDEAAVPPSSGLPRYVREGLVFPYAAGARLVNRIQGRGWAAVDRAIEEDPPVSTEQIMHPGKYLAGERPVRVRVEAPPGVRVVKRGDFGEFDTEQLLRDANGRALARRAAAGWGGGGFALWRSGVALRWVWDNARDASEFERALRAAARRLGGARVNSRNGGVELFVAPRG